MTLFTFLHHQWLNFWRARNAGKSLALQIFMGFFYVLIFVYIAVLGVLLPMLLKDAYPAKEPVTLYCTYILYYFLIGFLARFQLQELPTLSIQPYLSQNISRRSMVRFLNTRSLLHFLNFLPLFVFIPFTVVEIVPAYGPVAAICFLVGMFALVINNHFLNMYVKRKATNSSWWLIGMALFILAIKGMDYLKILSFEKFSAAVFIFMLQHPLLCVVPVVLALLSFFINNQYLKSHLYVEELQRENKLISGKNYSFLNRHGEIGALIELDVKLILRNKRAKSLMLTSIFFLLYGFILYPQSLREGNDYLLFFAAQFVTGIFILNYGQFFFAWQSSHFDGTMSYNTNMKQFITAKLVLMFTVSGIQFLIVCFYGFMSWKIIPIEVAAFLFNIGVNSFILIFAATFNYKYFDISKSANMNRQGTGGLQILKGFAVAFLPTVLFFLLHKFLGLWPTVILFSCMGIGGLICKAYLINWLTAQFYIRKHKILEGFRER